MNPIGIYEKALPRGISWRERLQYAKELGFDFVEMSIDETDERLARLDWTIEQRADLVNAIFETGVRVPTICLSGHRRFPMGSRDPAIRERAMEIMNKALILAADIGVRVIQLAAEKQIALAIEIMDDSFMSSITKYLSISSEINSPWLYVYPDVGNLSAWGNDVIKELRRGCYEIAAVHLKDTLPVTENSRGKFKDVPFGEGCVDFYRCLKTLRSLDYSGPFMIEMWSEASDDWRAEVKSALDFLLPILKEAGYDYGDQFAGA